MSEIAVSKDSPGFIANAILMPMLNEAIMVLEKVSHTRYVPLTTGHSDS